MTGGDEAAAFLVGEGANLESLRAAIGTGNDETISIALQQLMDETREERVLVSLTPVVLSLQTAHDDDEDDDDDDGQDEEDEMGDNQNENEREGQAIENTEDTFQNVPGNVIITSERFLFVASQEEVEAQTVSQDDTNQQQNRSSHKRDIAMDAQCIHLHAQSADPISVYVQLEGTNDEASPTEITIIPTAESENDKKEICEQLFSKLSELVALHPIAANEDQQQGGAAAAGMMAMMNMMMGGPDAAANGMNNGNHTKVTNNNDGMVTRDNNDDDDEMIVASPSTTRQLPPTASEHQFSDCEDEEKEEEEEKVGKIDDSSDQGATPEERAAMLERLDNLLVVEPGLEIPEDQFADAEEETDITQEIIINQAESTPQQPTTVPTVASEEKKPPKTAGQFDDADDPLL